MTDDMSDEARAAAWDDLEAALGRWLQDVPPDGCVILELPWEAESPGTAPYVQVLVDGVTVHSEAASDDVLAPVFRLGDERLAVLAGLGWQEPADPGVTTNLSVDEEVPEDAPRIASRLVTTLRDVYGVPHPSFLQARGFDDEGPLDAEGLPFGLRVAEPVTPAVDCTALVVDGPDDLRDLVAEVVGEVTGDPAEFDPDGDVPVPTEHSVVYVRVEDGAPVVRLIAPVLCEVAWRPRVGYELNRVNSGAYFARVVHDDEVVRLELELDARPFVPELLRSAVLGMRATVDDLAPRLQQQIGGRLVNQPRRRRV